MAESQPRFAASADSLASDPPRGAPGDYVQLLKPRVMSLVAFTALVGLVLAPGAIHPVIAVVAMLCIAVGAGASVRPRHRRGDGAHAWPADSGGSRRA